MAERVPGIDDDQVGEESRQSDEEHADTIHGQVIADAQRGNPLRMLDKLHGGGIRHESHEDENCQGQFDQGDRQSRCPDHVFVVEQPQHRGTRQGEKEQAGENRKC